MAPQDSTNLTRLLGEVLNSKRKNERLNTKFRWRSVSQKLNELYQEILYG